MLKPAQLESKVAPRHLAVEVLDSARAFPADVLNLMAMHDLASIQFGASWFHNLEQSVFSADRGIRYFVLRDSGLPIAVLPLRFVGSRFARKAQALGNYYTCLYAPALSPDVDAVALSRLLVAVRTQCGTLASLTLSPMSTEDRSFELLESALRLAGYRVSRYFCFGNWHLRGSNGWGSYLASRDGKLRNTIKRMSQRLTTELGRVEIVSDEADLERGIAAYLAVYAKSWKVPEPSTEFMPGLMRLCAAQGALRLGLVWLQGQPIAAQLWIVHGGRAEIYKVAYDEAFKSFSPGTVLTARMLEHVLEEDLVTEVDYLIGDDPYKKNWMNLRRERWGLVAYNSRSAVGIISLAVEFARQVGRPWMKQIRNWRSRRSSVASQPPR